MPVDIDDDNPTVIIEADNMASKAVAKATAGGVMKLSQVSCPQGCQTPS